MSTDPTTPAVNPAVPHHRVILASASPARHRLLTSAGIEVEVQSSGVDEDAVAASLGEAGPRQIALELARAKTRVVADDPPPLPGYRDEEPDRLVVIGCDSVLELPDVPEYRGRALGKPRDAQDARQRWRAMRGHSGLLHTGHCVIAQPCGAGPESAERQEISDTVTTRVHFAAEISDVEIDAYVATGEPLTLAGAFALDGLASAFIDGVDGDPSNVIGISLPLVRRLFARVGVQWPDLWAQTLRR